MITTWISASLLALTGWQGYRLGKEYGWWGRPSIPARKQEVASPSPETSASAGNGLGQSKTDFDRLLTGFAPTTELSTPLTPNDVGEDIDIIESSQPVIEPTTTLMEVEDPSDETEYPEETDQIPETCSWMDDEDISLIEAGDDGEPNDVQTVVPVDDYVKRVRTVQRKMTQLTKRRNADTTFVKQELGVLIETYQLENDQSLEWLFQQHETSAQPDYGSLFDRLESLVA